MNMTLLDRLELGQNNLRQSKPIVKLRPAIVYTVGRRVGNYLTRSFLESLNSRFSVIFLGAPRTIIMSTFFYAFIYVPLLNL